MSSISVILPIHKIGSEKEEEYLHKALKSVDEQNTLPEELLVVIPSSTNGENVKKFVNNYKFENMKNVRFIENSGETDFCSQVNLGAGEVKTDYFSILEFDDLYSNIWFDNVVQYIETYDVDMYLPIVIDMNVEDKFLHFTNEVVWAKEFSDKQGFLDNDALLNYPKFQISGSVIKTEVFNTIGKLKPSIKVQFGYEFMLRMSYYDKKIMTIPKLGYKKINMRPNSIFWEHENGENKIDPIESKFWFNLARKESYFKSDRGITYEEEIDEIIQ